jgi:ribonuclease R
METLERVVGILKEDGRNGLVVPERPGGLVPVRIAQRDLGGAPFGMKVVVEILFRPDEEPRGTRSLDAPLARGRVVETLGDPAEPDVAVAGILRAYGLKESFPEAAEREALAFGTDPSDEDVARELARGRRDLCGERLVTIDGADAKDLDDAVSVEALKDGGFRLGVHIADVSWYVREGTALDAEARSRGTSVYPPGRVVPMLPPKLSNGICSLNPGRPRFAFSCVMDFTPEGEPRGHEIFESLIRTVERMTYDDVFSILSTPEGEETELSIRYAELLPDFRRMHELARLLRGRRFGRGAMDFDFAETKVVLDEAGVPIDIHPYRTTFANGLIEEFMILANETVAEHFLRLGSPFAYRVHEPPDPERLHRFEVIASNFGEIHRFKAEGADSAQLAKILEDVRGKPYGRLLSRILLRSLAKARYSPECLGHFSLASPYYCHFTSPIRRYPDLFIHRIMKIWLQESPGAKPGAALPRSLSLRLASFRESADSVCLGCSFTERRAEQAERDVVSQKSAEYMAQRVGEAYEGVVSGIVGAGLFVELESTVEGMVAFATLDDYFDYDEEGFYAKGRRSGETFHVGDRLRIQVTRADTVTRRIDFALLARVGASVGEGRKGAGKGRTVGKGGEPNKGGASRKKAKAAARGRKASGPPAGRRKTSRGRRRGGASPGRG